MSTLHDENPKPESFEFFEFKIAPHLTRYGGNFPVIRPSIISLSTSKNPARRMEYATLAVFLQPQSAWPCRGIGVYRAASSAKIVRSSASCTVFWWHKESRCQNFKSCISSHSSEQILTKSRYLSCGVTWFIIEYTYSCGVPTSLRKIFLSPLDNSLRRFTRKSRAVILSWWSR